MEEQKLRILVFGSCSSDISAFIRSVDETSVVLASPNPIYFPPTNISPMVWGQYSIAKSLRLFLIGLEDWMMFFTKVELQTFVKDAHAFIVLIDSTDTASLATIQSILDKVRSYKAIPHTLIVTKLNNPDALKISQLLDVLCLDIDEILLPCLEANTNDVKATLLSIQIKVGSSIQSIEVTARHSA